MAIKDLEILPGCRLPACASAIEELYDWSLNFNYSQGNPFQIFCDLLGYGYEEYGEVSNFTGKTYFECLGYKECCLLGDALKLFENNGYPQVYDWVTTLINSEYED